MKILPKQYLSSNDLMTVVLVLMNLLSSEANTNHKSRHVQHHQQQHSRRAHKPTQQRLLLVSFGGFRHDFIENYNLKNFRQFQSEGARGAYLNPQFTTQAFPNHWSMATGAYVENHGIVANKFYDPLYGEFFLKHNTELKWWNDTEPFWSMAVREGLKTGVYHWPGSESLFPHMDSDLYTYVPYNDNTPLNAKINQAVKWLAVEDYKLACVYHNQPDAIAHKYGLNSPEFNVTLSQLDDSFGHLIAQLKTNNLYGRGDFNMIVLSDHGISNIKKNIFINDYFDERDAEIWSFSRNLIHLKPVVSLDGLMTKLARIPDITVTLKSDIPDRLNYREHRRIGQVIVSALDGVGFIYMSKEPMQINGKTSHVQLTYEQKKRLLLAASDKASHGYDNIYPNMRGIFMAKGAVFRRNYSSDGYVDNVDVYPLVCALLAIECPPRNGSFDRVRPYLNLEHGVFQHQAGISGKNAFFLNSVLNCSTGSLVHLATALRYLSLNVFFLIFVYFF